MISGPDTARPDIPGRSVRASSRDLTRSFILVRRLYRAVLCAFSLYLSFIIASPAGDKPGSLNLFVDIASTRLAEEVQTTEKRELELAGVPVLVGTKRQNNGAAASVTAGIAGSRDFTLGNNLSMTASGLVSRVHTDGTGLLSSGHVGGDFAVKYQQGGTRLLLRPSLYAALQDETLDHIDYALENKLWQAIGWGFDLTATAGAGWRASDQVPTDDRETAFGRLGLHWALLDKTDLEFAYAFDVTNGPLPSQYRFAQGPTIMANLGLDDGWRLYGRYSLNAVERGYDDNQANARRHDMRHRFNFVSDWDLGSTTGADWHMQAAYDFEQTLTDAPVCYPANHIASVQFALNF
jgi:hypothetical protein